MGHSVLIANWPQRVPGTLSTSRAQRPKATPIRPGCLGRLPNGHISGCENPVLKVGLFQDFTHFNAVFCPSSISTQRKEATANSCPKLSLTLIFLGCRMCTFSGLHILSQALL